ncbi:MAG: hypothetical protein M1828_003283 [Chrysothrix sp. TS-e1954]|nr:MAG: hypothetical protein M1828_003283 [Chrysothrix sp. TS-e1954]
MASQPPRQVPRRQSPPQRSSSEQAPHAQRADSSAVSTTSVDSQTLFLNDSVNDGSSQRNEQDDGAQTSPTQQGQSSTDETSEPRRCWICFSDDTEDTPESGTWRTPCPCALTAHESCLLDWIADMEAPDASRSTSTPKKLQCPQCKSEIRLARPQSWIVKGLNVVEKYKGKALLPAVVVGMGWGLIICFSHHGAHTVRMIFGEHDAERILAPATQPTWLEHQMHWFYPEMLHDAIKDWRGPRVEIGLPLIPAALIASRTTFADYVLPILPLFFFATHEEASKSLSSNNYPPSAALTLAVLPYLRGMYDEYLERVWGARERAWVKEISPRLGHDGSTNNGEENHGHVHEEDDVVELELNLGLDIEEVEEAGNGDNDREDRAGNLDAIPPDIPRARAPGLNEPPTDVAQEGHGNDADTQPPNADEARAPDAEQGPEQQEPPQGQQQQQQNQPGVHDLHRHENNILISGTRIADTIVGALIFPSIAAGSGEILKLVLPHSWVMPSYWRGQPTATGLLQTKWGRSIIGGCLFVVLKDAIRIYCRWKMAQAFRKRKVLDYDKKTGRIIESQS